MSDTLTENVILTEQDMEEALSGVIRQLQETNRRIEMSQTETSRIEAEMVGLRQESERQMQELCSLVASLEARA